MTSLKPTPGCGQSGTSRIFDLQLHALSLRDELAEPAPEQALRRARARARRASGGRACPAAAAPGSASGARARSTASSRPASRSVDVRNVRRWRGRDAEAREPAADRGDLGVGLGVEPLAALDPRREQAVLLELARQPRARSRRARRASPGRARPRRPAARCARRRRRSGDVGFSSSSRITFSGRNSSRCRRRIVSRRSTSSSPNSR